MLLYQRRYQLCAEYYSKDHADCDRNDYVEVQRLDLNSIDDRVVNAQQHHDERPAQTGDNHRDSGNECTNQQLYGDENAESLDRFGGGNEVVCLHVAVQDSQPDNKPHRQYKRQQAKRSDFLFSGPHVEYHGNASQDKSDEVHVCLNAVVFKQVLDKSGKSQNTNARANPEEKQEHNVLDDGPDSGYRLCKLVVNTENHKHGAAGNARDNVSNTENYPAQDKLQIAQKLLHN